VVAVPKSELFDPVAQVSRLDERLTNFGSRLTTLEQSSQQGFSAISAQLTSFAAELRSSQKTSWGTIIGLMTVGLTIIAMVGGLVWYPAQTAVGELKAHDQVVDKLLTEMPEKFLSLQEFDRRLSRAAEDRQRVDAVLLALPEKYMSRKESDMMVERLNDMNERLHFLERGEMNGGH